MTDQEGGDVKRFLSAPPASSAAAMGAAGAATALQQGRLTGSALVRRGVNVDLAPVADVPMVAHSFLGTRAFGTTPQRVAQTSCQFAAGLHQGGVASALKHFPGLGRAVGNTDNQVVHIQAGAAAIAADLVPYRRCANAPANLVMVSNAAYSSITGAAPAVVAPEAYRLLRTARLPGRRDLRQPRRPRAGGRPGPGRGRGGRRAGPAAVDIGPARARRLRAAAGCRQRRPSSGGARARGGKSYPLLEAGARARIARARRRPGLTPAHLEKQHEHDPTSTVAAAR